MIIETDYDTHIMLILDPMCSLCLEKELKDGDGAKTWDGKSGKRRVRTRHPETETEPGILVLGVLNHTFDSVTNF